MILFNQLSVLYGVALNKGMMTENLVAQMLVSNGHKLRFYENIINENEKRVKYEVDFLLADEEKSTPIEAKSGNSSSHPSLDYFCEKYKKYSNKGIILTKSDLRITEKYVFLPLPMAMFL